MALSKEVWKLAQLFGPVYTILFLVLISAPYALSKGLPVWLWFILVFCVFLFTAVYTIYFAPKDNSLIAEQAPEADPAEPPDITPPDPIKIGQAWYGQKLAEVARVYELEHPPLADKLRRDAIAAFTMADEANSAQDVERERALSNQEPQL